MASVKVAITLDDDTLRQLDSLVARRVFVNRSRAMQIALNEKIARVGGSRLAAECTRLDAEFEQILAGDDVGTGRAPWQ